MGVSRSSSAAEALKNILFSRHREVAAGASSSRMYAAQNPTKAYRLITEPTVPEFFVSTVLEVNTLLGFHIVGQLGGPKRMPAFALMPVGANVVGARSHVVYPPGTAVLCMKMESGIAAIIGAMPWPACNNQQYVLSDFIAVGAESGYVHDDVHNHAATLSAVDKGDLINMVSGAPLDILPGDYVISNELSVGLGVSKLLSYMRAGDSAKIEFHWLDYLVRLCAYNYEFFNSIVERRIFNDEGEAHYTDFTALYPWEAVGLVEKGDFSREGESEYKKGCAEGKYEPQEDDQTGIFRQQIYKGFLGDVEREVIMAPDQSAGVRTLSGDFNDTGLLELVKHANGLYTVRSAKGIVLEKYALIPVPQQKALPDDGKDSSDSVTDEYTPSENGELEKKSWEYGEETPAIRAAQSWDYHSYMCNVSGFATLVNHKKDWKVQDESEVAIGGTASYSKSINTLRTEFSLPLPHVANVKIDARLTGEKYYLSRAAIELHDDGSITLEDAYGSQIIMSGGNITITAPGDVMTMPGRSAITWAPHDAVIRAGNSVDVTAAKHDVRLKAENNLHMLAGNSGESGGVYIECRNENSTFNYDNVEGEETQSSGIVLNAGTGPVMTYGKDVYIRAGAKDPTGQERLILDSGRGKSDVLISGNNTFLFGKKTLAVATGTTFEEQEDSAVHMLMSKNSVIFDGNELRNAIIAGSLYLTNPSLTTDCNIVVDGRAIINGASLFGGGAIFDGGVLAKSLAQEAKSPMVGNDIKVDIKDEIEEPIKQVTNSIDQLRSDIEGTYAALGDIVYSDNRPGNDKFIAELKFSLRNARQYVSTGFKVYQSAWQRVCDNAGYGEVWDEPVVVGPKGDTLPHPGNDVWNGSNLMKVKNDAAFDIDAGRAKARDASVNTGSAPEAASLKNYKVIIQEV